MRTCPILKFLPSNIKACSEIPLNKSIDLYQKSIDWFLHYISFLLKIILGCNIQFTVIQFLTEVLFFLTQLCLFWLKMPYKPGRWNFENFELVIVHLKAAIDFSFSRSIFITMSKCKKKANKQANKQINN